MTAEGGPAVRVEAPLLASFAAQALDRQDVAEPLLQRRGGGGAGPPASPGAPAKGSGEGNRRRECDAEDRDGGPDDDRVIPEHAAQYQEDQDGEGGGRQWRQQDAVDAVGDGRGVVHDPEDGVADPLVVEGGHGQGLDAVEETGAVVVVQGLCETDREAEVEQPEQAAGHAEAGVGLVLGSGGLVVAARQVGFRLVPLGAAGADGSHQEDQEHLGADGPEQDFEGSPARQKVGEDSHDGGVGERLLADRNAQDEVVDDDLDRPGQDQQGKKTRDEEAELEREAALEGRDVAKRPGQQSERLEAGELLGLLESSAHCATPATAARIGASSVSTSFR